MDDEGVEGADDGSAVWEAVGLGGAVALVSVRPADHGSFWFRTPWQSYAQLTGDRSWWVDVAIPTYPFTLARESFPTRGTALARAEALGERFAAGELTRRYPPLRRRRFRWPTARPTSTSARKRRRPARR